MADAWRFSVSVGGAVVNDEGKLLAIQRRDNGHWEPPGGLVEPGETLTQALIREVHEETGYRVNPGLVSGVYQNMKRDIVAVVFRCGVASGAAHTSPESTRVEWLSPDQIRSRMDEAYAVRLLDALEPRGPVTRAHDGVHLLA